jgi:hypothetical protein
MRPVAETPAPLKRRRAVSDNVGRGDRPGHNCAGECSVQQGLCKMPAAAVAR